MSFWKVILKYNKNLEIQKSLYNFVDINKITFVEIQFILRDI